MNRATRRQTAMPIVIFTPRTSQTVSAGDAHLSDGWRTGD